MAIYVADWPHCPPEGLAPTLLHARAIENQCYIIGVNRTGNDPTCSYSGGSELIDPWGNIIAACERSELVL